MKKCKVEEIIKAYVGVGKDKTELDIYRMTCGKEELFSYNVDEHIKECMHD